MADALVANKIGRNEYFIYVGLFVLGWAFVASTLFTGWNSDVVYEPAFLLYADIGLSLGLSLLSLPVMYWVNRKGDGNDFWRRYICLDISISIFLMLFTLVVLVIGYGTGTLNFDVYGYADLGVAVFFNGAWLVMLWMYLKKVSTVSRVHAVTSSV